MFIFIRKMAITGSNSHPVAVEFLCDVTQAYNKDTILISMGLAKYIS